MAKIKKISINSMDKIIKDTYTPSDIEIELIGLCTDICVVSIALYLMK